MPEAVFIIGGTLAIVDFFKVLQEATQLFPFPILLQPVFRFSENSFVFC
jgi:hypothetical protein